MRASPGLDGSTSAAVAIGKDPRDGQLAPAADLHPDDAVIPALDDLTHAQPEVQRRTAIPRGVELLARRVRHADVVGADGVTSLGLDAITEHEVLDDQIDGGDLAREVDLRLGGVGVKTHDDRALSLAGGGSDECQDIDDEHQGVLGADQRRRNPLAPYPSEGARPAGCGCRRSVRPDPCPSR